MSSSDEAQSSEPMGRGKLTQLHKLQMKELKEKLRIDLKKAKENRPQDKVDLFSDFSSPTSQCIFSNILVYPAHAGAADADVVFETSRSRKL